MIDIFVIILLTHPGKNASSKLGLFLILKPAFTLCPIQYLKNTPTFLKHISNKYSKLCKIRSSTSLAEISNLAKFWGGERWGRAETYPGDSVEVLLVKIFYKPVSVYMSVCVWQGRGWVGSVCVEKRD